MTVLECEIAIIGGGCIGVSILNALVRSGISNIVLIDKGRTTTSATANSGGMFRVFHENPEHIRLALGHYRILQDFLHEGVLATESEPNGSLYFLNRHRLDRCKEGLQIMFEAQYPFEILNPIEGRKKFPEFRWDDEELAIYEPLAHQRDPGVFTDHLLRRCLKVRDVTLLESTEIKSIRSYHNRYLLSGVCQSVVAKSLVLAGGASLLPRFKDLGLNLALESRALTVFVSEKTNKTWKIPNYFDRERLEFGAFAHAQKVLLSHREQNRVWETMWEKDFEEKTAMDSYAPRRLGFLGQVCGHPQLFIATGWGGTAFKFALEVGHRMAHVMENRLHRKKENLRA
jgi:4-methylaminobutanoate oxidase (formaldehyde-forming)